MISGADIRKILEGAKTIAIVGASDNASRDSYRVMAYLIGIGYNVVPVNPAYKEIQSKKCYASLREIPDHVDIVDIFRRPDDVPAVVGDAIAAGAGTVWMQLGIINEAAAISAGEAGLNVVMNRCIMIEHKSLFHGI